MNMGNLISYLILCGVILFAFIVVGIVIARLYRRSTKEQSFVRLWWSSSDYERRCFSITRLTRSYLG